MDDKRCIFCGKPLNDGIIILGKRICRDCIVKIKFTKPDSIFYDYYRDCIKKEITKEIIKGEEFIWTDYH